MSIEDQAVGRLHRIGQQSNVVVYRLLTKDTIEEKIVDMQARKRKAVADAVSVSPLLWGARVCVPPCAVLGFCGSLQAVSRDEKEKLATTELWDMFGISKE